MSLNMETSAVAAFPSSSLSPVTYALISPPPLFPITSLRSYKIFTATKMCCFVLVHVACPLGMLWSFQRHSFPVIFMVKYSMENVDFKKAKGILDTMFKFQTYQYRPISVNRFCLNNQQCFIEYLILSLPIGGIPAMDFRYNELLVMTVR